MDGRYEQYNGNLDGDIDLGVLGEDFISWTQWKNLNQSRKDVGLKLQAPSSKLNSTDLILVVGAKLP